MSDDIDHPTHYTSHPSGIEVIAVTEQMSFCLGNAWKYIARSGLKGGLDDAHRDIRKALWYLRRELMQRTSTPSAASHDWIGLALRFVNAEPVAWKRDALTSIVSAQLVPNATHKELELERAIAQLEGLFPEVKTNG